MSVNPPYFTYSAYGLTVLSTIRFPELLVAQRGEPDVTIRLASLRYSPLGTESPHCFQLTAEGMYVFWRGLGTFLVHDGKRITVDPVPGADEDLLRQLIVGAAMGVVLWQRGFLVLHGSAVDVNGRAVVFLGTKGGGKSTLAATLHRRGHDLVTDDVVAIDLSWGDRNMVIPSFPQLKLWPEAAAASLGANPEDLPRLAAHMEKRKHRLAEGFRESPLPLKHVYVLGCGPKVEIASLETQDVLTSLVRYSYLTRFGDTVLQADTASHFLQLTRLVRQVSVHRLLRPAALELLPLAAQLIEEKSGEEA